MKYTEEMIDKIIYSLPHGSGINSKWEYKIDTKGKLHFYNTYDYMDENQNRISGYGYGHIPGHRIYRIYLKDGSYMDWEVKKR